MAEELLYNTRYNLPSRAVSRDDASKEQDRDSFRRFWEQSRGLPGLSSTSSQVQNLFDSANQHPAKTLPTLSLRDDQKLRPAAYQRSKIICIDSKDRDLKLYPDPASFRIYFGEQFTNVCRIQLLDTQLPNTEQLIRSQPANKRNDTISWINGPDEEDHGQIYSITITPGNYTPDTFANEIVTKAAAVARNLPSSSEKIYHSFDVEVNGITNTFLMRQNRSSTIANPFSTVAGSPTVTVNQASHGFFSGQIVNLSGCTSIAGFSADMFNAAQVINVITEKIDALVENEDSSTSVLFGTTFKAFSGRVCVVKDTNIVHGCGTQFLSEIFPGNVINIGYHTYTVDCVITDVQLVVEEALQETFDEFTLIKDLSGNNQGMLPYAGDSTMTQVNCLKTRVRNIGADKIAADLEQAYKDAKSIADKILPPTSIPAIIARQKADAAAAKYTAAAIVLANDATYQASNADLSLSIYNKIQKTIYISDLAKSFKLTSTFASRDTPTILQSSPTKTYKTYSSFFLKDSIENFNVEQVVDANSATLTITSGSSTNVVTIPAGTRSTIGMLYVLKSILPGWKVQFDTVGRIFYFSPPENLGSTATITVTSQTYVYKTQIPSSFHDISTNASNILGLPTSAAGTVVVSTMQVNASAKITITFDSAVYVLDENFNLLCKMSVSAQEFSNISDLISLLNSILVVRAVPIVFTYLPGMLAVVLTASSALPVFQIAFPERQAGGLGSAMGFDYSFIHKNLTIKSQSAINNILREGYYSHKFLDYINAVGIYKSRQTRGLASITNTSNRVTGSHDTFSGIVVGSFDSDTASVKGILSNNTWLIQKIPSDIVSDPTLSYFQGSSATVAQNFAVTEQYVDVYVVQYVQNRFSFVRAVDNKCFGDSELVYEMGRTLCFDLRSLPLDHVFKLSKFQNGNWSLHSDIKITAELLEFTRYVFNGQFLQICIPENTILPTPYLYVFDERHEDTIASNPTVIPNKLNQAELMNLTSTFYFSLPQSEKQLHVSQTLGDGIETPVIHMSVGHIYVLDFSAIVGSDSLLLSTSVDGSHFNNGSSLTNSTCQFLSAGSSSITLNLSAEKGPFPRRLFYFLQSLAGAGGDGYIQIGFADHSGAIAIQPAGRSKFCLFRGASVISSSTSADLTQSNHTTIYSPFVNSRSLPFNSSINLLDSSRNVTGSTIDGMVVNVTKDNNRFVIMDEAVQQEITVTIEIGFKNANDIVDDLARDINESFNIIDPLSQWQIVLDQASSKFTFVIQNNRHYSFRFSGVDSDNQELYNSAAELLGFSRTETPTNILNTSFNIVSSTAANFSETARHCFSISSVNVYGTHFTAWSEPLIDTETGKTQTVVCKPFFSRFSGTRFTKDFAVNDTILLGTDYDRTFTIVAIVNDYELILNSNVAIVGSGVDATTGLPTPAPATIYYVKLFQLNAYEQAGFSNNDEMIFNRSLVARSACDYDGRLVGKQFLVNRISPIKLSFPETNILLMSSESDTGHVYNYTSVNHHDLFYVSNNSKYQFMLGVPATSTVANKGGNPISVGTGVKYQLLFSQTNTPGNILGFPNVGVPAQGDTKFYTVQSNTLPDASTTVEILRSVPGAGNYANSLQIVTMSPHNFQFGDTVYINGHSGSSNDVAVNSDEGYTINLDPSNTVFAESVNGLSHIRGSFYVPLSVTRGGMSGQAFRRKLYRPFALAGDNYVYLTCPLLSSLKTTSSKVQNIFAKIALNSPPGSIIFNSFTSTEKVFDDSTVAFLDHLDFTVVDGQGELFLFNNTDWSCSLRITVSSCTLPSTGISSRTDLYSENASGNATSSLQTHS